MKNKYILILILTILPSVILILNSYTKEKNSAEEKKSEEVSFANAEYSDTVFKIGTFSPGYNSIDAGSKGDPYNWFYIIKMFIDFGFNSSIFYSDPVRYTQSGPNNVLYDGGLFEDINRYKNSVSNFMNYFASKNLTGNFDRGTIKKLCSSQMSIYEAEDSLNYGFKNDISSKTGMYFDSLGVKGRSAITGRDNAGYLVSGLIENAEQSDTWFAIGVGGQDDSLWYIRPRMRIDSANAFLYQNVPIARVDILGFSGAVIKSVEISGKQFLDSISGKYYGEFKEDFGNLPLNSGLWISGGVKQGELNHDATTDFDSCFNFKSCKIDYRIYWYGVCNMWVDYVKVEDKWAYNMFENNSEGKFYRDKICAEAKAFEGSAKYFHYDEVRKNNLSSIKFVQNILDSVTGNKIKIVPIASSLNNELKNKYTDFSYYLDYVNPRFLLTDCYPFYFMGNYINVPDKNPFQSWLPPNAEINKTNLEFLKADYSTYTNRIQYDRLGDKTSNWDATKSLKHFSFVAHLYRNTTDAIAKGIEHLIAIQAHSFISEETNGTCIGINLREPTVEEIRVQTSLSLCYGVKGIYYFCFNGDRPPNPKNGSGGIKDYPNILPNDNQTKMIGMAYYSGSGFALPVTSNYYGQNKYLNVKEINEKINAMGPLLTRLDWQGAFSVHSEGANHFYVNDIISKYYYQNQNYPGCKINGELCDCRESRFWEFGFFNSRVQGDENSRYFMAVNRRTVPDSPIRSGDLRILSIKFDKQYLASSAKWKLTDVYTNQSVKFSGSVTDYLNLETLGIFQPGEGKLFKLEPVK